MASIADLEKTIREVAGRVRRFREGRPLNEQNTKSSLIEPVLRALGWNLEDPDVVHHEFKSRPRDKPVDYALLVNGKIRLLIEAKGMSQDRRDRKWASQIVSYAAVAGAEWVVLTDGEEWRIYNALAAVDVEEKLLRSVKVTDDSALIARTLRLLAKDRMQENPLDALWRMHHVDRQVQTELRRLLRPDQSSDLLAMLTKALPKFSPADVRASYGRFDIDVRYRQPIDMTDVSVDSAPRLRISKGKRSRTRVVSTASLESLIAAGILKAPLEVFAEAGGQRFVARIDADAVVTFDGKTFDSLSAAASAARAKSHGRRANSGELATNGWEFWKWTNESGQSRPIGDLRQKLEGVEFDRTESRAMRS